MSTDYHHVSNAGRKRARVDYDSREQTPNRDEELMDPASPIPFVNTRYKIKGGMDTPTLAAARMQESESEYSDIGYRRELSGTQSGLLGEETGGYQSFLPLDLNRESNGRSRRSSDRSFTENHDGWSKTALGVVGEVVGKVWEFCKKSAFTGFHAGGGKGYTVKNTDESHFSLEINEKSWETEQITTSWGDDRESTPLPGKFPDEDFIPNYMANPTPEPTPPRTGKRRQIGNSTDELARNWVVVPPSQSASTPTNPQIRGPARYSMQTASSASRRSVVPRPTSRASTIAPRRPMLQRVSHAGSPALQTNHGASFASPRSPGGSKIPRATGSPVRSLAEPKVDSPAAREAARWAAMKKKEEREADITIRRLDAQLKAMIREGKEALGTKIEVEMDDELDRIPKPGIKQRWGV